MRDGASYETTPPSCSSYFSLSWAAAMAIKDALKTGVGYRSDTLPQSTQIMALSAPSNPSEQGLAYRRATARRTCLLCELCNGLQFTWHPLSVPGIDSRACRSGEAAAEYSLQAAGYLAKPI